MIVTVIGDLHISGKNPISRTDDLTETQFLKVKEIVEFANKHNTNIISVGDIFNTSVVANSLVNRFGGLLNELKGNFYFVWGNHDLLYHSIDLWDRTSLGILWRNNPKVKHISEHGSFDYIDWDNEIQKSDNSFLLSHKAIVSESQINKNFWVGNDKTFALPVTDKSLKQYKFILCGHWHKPYYFEYKNIKVLNPGPVVRQTVEDCLEPSICLVDLKKGVFSRHKLKSAKPFSEVLSSTHLDSKVSNSSHIQEFIESLKLRNVKHDSAFMENLNKIIEQNKLDKKLTKILYSILEKVKEKKNK